MSLLEVSRIESYQLENGRTRHRMELVHHGLKQHRVIRSDDPGILERKAEIQIAEWEERWAGREARREEAERRRRKADEASHRAEAARAALARLRGTLAHTLETDYRIHWDELHDGRGFTRPRPARPPLPPEPVPDDPRYGFELTVLDRLLPHRRKARETESSARYEADRAEWEERVAELVRTHEADLARWQEQRDAWEARREDTNRAVEEQRRRYMARDPEAITGYCDLVLARSDYPEDFPREFEVHYDPGTETLVVEYRLPSPDALPTLRDVRYSRSRDAFAERHLTPPQSARLYDDVVYQIALRTIHELLEADVVGAICRVVFNGRVETVDPATGHEIDACLVSVAADRDEFLTLRLSHVDAARCFRALGGVQGGAPHEIVPVDPLAGAEARPDDR